MLEYDDREVASVRDSLTALLLQNPSSSAERIGDQLESDHLGAITETEVPVEYVFRWVNGHWVHDMVSLTQFVVDFGQHRTVLVEVEVTEPK